MTVFITNLVIFAASLVITADRPMRCYQCNSAKDPNCDSRDAKDLRQYVKICQMLEGGTYIGNEPIACRKIVQSVEDLPVQTIRECAYTGDKDLNGLRKQGNKAIKLLYYQCENVDGDTPCNDSQQVTTRYLILIFLFVILISACNFNHF